MKTILSFYFGIFFMLCNAQDVSDYKYISIPTNFSGFDANQYQLNNYLRLLLSQKDYEVLSDKNAYWPKQVKLNPCLVLTADVEKISSTFRNKVKLSFRDCNQTVLYSFDGESKIKELEAGYKDALKNATQSIHKQNAQIPNYREQETKEVVIKTTKTIPNEGTELFKKYSNRLNPDDLMLNNMPVNGVYTYNGKTYFKSNLDNGEFYIISKDKRQLLAHYFPSSKPGIYYVHLGNAVQVFGSNVIGYFDENGLSYEFLNKDKSPEVVTFESK